MVSHFYTVLDVFECHHPIADLLAGSCSLAGREKVFQYLGHSFTKGTVKIFEYEVGVRFADRALRSVGEVVTEEDIM